MKPQRRLDIFSILKKNVTIQYTLHREGYDLKHEVRDLQHRTESIHGAVGKYPVFHRLKLQPSRFRKGAE